MLTFLGFVSNLTQISSGMSEISSSVGERKSEREYLTYTLLPRLEMGDKLGDKLAGFERLQVTGLLRLVIDNNRPVTTPVTTSF